jgi:predicted glycogen debranching enzyme
MMNLPILRLSKKELSNFNESIRKEWLITNGLGGYSSSTVLGINTRKYHGLLVAALHPPGDRTLCISKIDEEVNIGKEKFNLGSNEFHDVIYPEGFHFLESFSVSPFPQYIYSVRNLLVSKTIFLPYGQNALVSKYTIQNGVSSNATLKLVPLLTCRYFHQVNSKSDGKFKVVQNQVGENEVQLDFDASGVRLNVRAILGKFCSKPNWIERIFYREEALRGESNVDDCYQPGYFEIEVPRNSEKDFVIIASANAKYQQKNVGDLDSVISVADANSLLNEELKHQAAIVESGNSTLPHFPKPDWLAWISLAADSFLVKGPNKGKSVIAGYHWFEAWGRDTFISLPGLMLVTGRFEDARKVLVDFNKFCTQGLIPNFLSDLSLLPSCNTVDATLWYVNSVLQYLKYTNDFGFVHSQLWDSLKEIMENHVKGTGFGIHVDTDGLLSHGERLTWMDAEADGKAVTPRAGKAVEIQALWFNALMIMKLLSEKFAERSLTDTFTALGDRVKLSFEKKFWNAEKGCLFDALIESGGDPTLRPNQVIASALDFTMLDKQSNQRILDIVQVELLTPCGLRTLSRNDSRYRGFYSGDRRSRDQAYHNGTVWPWLLGPFVKAYVKTKWGVNPDADQALKNMLELFFEQQITQSCLGAVNEIFDGDLPHKPRGCVSQAWSVAEPLRAYIEDILQLRPRYEQAILASTT